MAIQTSVMHLNRQMLAVHVPVEHVHHLQYFINIIKYCCPEHV